MIVKDSASQDLRRIEDLIFKARHIAGQRNDADLYGKLDDALLLVQHLGMGLKLERENRSL